jgi:hypothetical protein
MKKTGVEPWFKCWAKVKYAIAMARLEWANHRAYQRNM